MNTLMYFATQCMTQQSEMTACLCVKLRWRELKRHLSLKESLSEKNLKNSAQRNADSVGSIQKGRKGGRKHDTVTGEIPEPLVRPT